MNNNQRYLAKNILLILRQLGIDSNTSELGFPKDALDFVTDNQEEISDLVIQLQTSYELAFRLPLCGQLLWDNLEHAMYRLMDEYYRQGRIKSLTDTVISHLFRSSGNPVMASDARETFREMIFILFANDGTTNSFRLRECVDRFSDWLVKTYELETYNSEKEEAVHIDASKGIVSFGGKEIFGLNQIQIKALVILKKTGGIMTYAKLAEAVFDKKGADEGTIRKPLAQLIKDHPGLISTKHGSGVQLAR